MMGIKANMSREDARFNTFSKGCYSGGEPALLHTFMRSSAPLVVPRVAGLGVKRSRRMTLPCVPSPETCALLMSHRETPNSAGQCRVRPTAGRQHADNDVREQRDGRVPIPRTGMDWKGMCVFVVITPEQSGRQRQWQRNDVATT